MTESYGMNFNMAYTTDKDGKTTVGIHLTDSDGMDINKETTDSNASKAVTSLFNELSTDLLTINKAKKLEKEKKEAAKRKAETEKKEKKVKELRAQAEKLREQLKQIDKDIESFEKPAPKKNIKSYHADANAYAEYLKNLKSIDDIFSKLF